MEVNLVKSLKVSVLDLDFFIGEFIYEDSQTIIAEREGTFIKFELDDNDNLVQNKILKSEAMYYVDLAERS